MSNPNRSRGQIGTASPGRLIPRVLREPIISPGLVKRIRVQSLRRPFKTTMVYGQQA